MALLENMNFNVFQSHAAKSLSINWHNLIYGIHFNPSPPLTRIIFFLPFDIGQKVYQYQFPYYGCYAISTDFLKQNQIDSTYFRVKLVEILSEAVCILPTRVFT